MKVKYIIDKNESEFKKTELFKQVIQTFGTNVYINGGRIEVEKNDESKIVQILTHSGLKYQKAA